jgi:hypothetical protein
MLTVYTDIAECINTSESFSKQTIIKGNNVIVPYVNLQLVTPNPIMDKVCHIDFSYLIFRGVSEVVQDGSHRICFFDADGSDMQEEYIMLNSWLDNKGVEWRIRFRQADLYVRDGNTSILTGSEFFGIYSTPSYPKNVSDEDINYFFSDGNLRDVVSRIV